MSEKFDPIGIFQDAKSMKQTLTTEYPFGSGVLTVHEEEGICFATCMEGCRPKWGNGLAQRFAQRFGITVEEVLAANFQGAMRPLQVSVDGGKTKVTVNFAALSCQSACEFQPSAVAPVSVHAMSQLHDGTWERSGVVGQAFPSAQLAMNALEELIHKTTSQ